MKKFLLQAVFSIIAITFLSFSISPVGFPQNIQQENSGQNSEAVEFFLTDLYNQLVARGYISSSPFSNFDEIWNRDFSQFLAALRLYNENRGGILTPTHLYDSNQKTQVIYNENNFLYLNLSDPDQTIAIGEQRGITNYELMPVDFQTENLGFAITGNVQRLYAKFLRDWFFKVKRSGVIPDLASARDSGVKEFLTSYLDSLKSNGLIEHYDFHSLPDTLLIQVPTWADGEKAVPFELVPEFVNFFETIDEEAHSIENEINEDLSEYFVYAEPGKNRRPSRFFRSDLEFALQDAANAQEENWSTEQIRNAFLQTSGQRSSSCTPNYDDYGFLTVTPKNTCITALQGAYTAPYSSNEGATLRDKLSSLQQYGYQIHKIDGRFAGTPRENFSAQALMYAQTYILDGHGRADGSLAAFCYPNIPYGPQCCEAVRARAQALGFPTRNLNCSQPGPYHDDTGSIFGYDSGNRRCDDGNPPNPNWPGDAGNRCQINIYPSFFSGYGPKAAIFTEQCDAPGFGNEVMDYWSIGTCQLSIDSSVKHDSDLLSNDLLGRNQRHLFCTSTPPQHPSGPFCTSNGDGLLGFFLREVQTSQSTRGTTSLPPEQCHSEYNNWNGYEKYCQAVVTGREVTFVEFAPSVLLAGLSFPDVGPQFTAIFTSDVKPFHGSITAEVVGAKPRFQHEGRGPGYVYNLQGAYGSAAVHERDASLLFNPTFKFMGEGAQHEWMTEFPPNMSLKYGHTQADWPWYIKVTIEGVQAFPNGVALDGNGTAPDKWIWPHPDGQTINVEPWANLRGVAANGDSAKFKIPLLPNFGCCMPNLEARPVDPDDPSSPAATVQNGCTCTEVQYLGTNPNQNPYSQCYNMGLAGTINEGEIFPGTVHEDYYSCCGGPWCGPHGECPPLPPDQCYAGISTILGDCPHPPYPPDTHTIGSVYQYREWPLDAGAAPEQCEQIVSECVTDQPPKPNP